MGDVPETESGNFSVFTVTCELLINNTGLEYIQMHSSIYSYIYIYIYIHTLIPYSYVDFIFSTACNGSITVSDELTEPVILQYRSSGDWNHLASTNGTSGKRPLQFL